MRPTLSVVVPVYNVERYLAACLDSLVAQDLASMEVIVVDDGSTDRSPDIVAEYRARDSRIRAYRQPNAGLGPARNAGIGCARGTYLTFVDSDDVVPPGSWSYVVRVLRASGSDFAVGGVRRLMSGGTYRPSWTAAVHEHDRIGTSIDRFPAALLDVVAHHRVFRRDFWLDRIGAFPTGLYEDHVPMVAAYLRARRFDVLSRVIYDWRIREDRTSIGQQKHDIANLEERITVLRQAEALVEEEASEEVQATWVGRVLDIDLPPYINHALRAGDAYRDALQAAMAHYSAMAATDADVRVRVQQKVRTHLVARGRWADLERAQQIFRRQGSIPPTTVRDGHVAMADDLSKELSIPLPARMLVLSASESRLQVCAERAEWLTASTLRLSGWSVVRGLDLSQRKPRLAAWLVATDGRRTELPVEQVASPAATRWVGWTHGSFDAGGFRMLIDAEELQGDGPWRLELRMEVDGVVRVGGVHHAVAGSSASRGSIGQLATAVGARLVPRFDAEHGLVLMRPGIRHRIRSMVSSVRVHTQVTAVEPAGQTVRLSTSRRVRTAAMRAGATRIDGIIEGPRQVGVPLRRTDGRALPSGGWQAVADGARLTLATDVAQRLPRDLLTSTHRVRVTIDRGLALVLELDAPLRDDELGVRAQHLLQTAYATDARDPVAGALLIGDEAVDGSLARLAAAAVPAGLHRWASVADLAASIPAGSEAVVIGSRTWYERMAEATLIVTARDLEWWFAKRPHQRVLRVFLEPDASIGRSAWWEAGFTPGQIAEEIARAAQWDAIIVPDADQGARYRDELAYGGPMYTAGTPASTMLGELSDAS